MLEGVVNNNLEKLIECDYPGRGIALGLTPSGEELVQIFWTMGRSQNSKNRIMIKDGETVKTLPFDRSLELQHEDLIIYNVSAQSEKYHIITNGRQTDTIVDFLIHGNSFENALYLWGFEGDEPIYTARISGLSIVDGTKIGYKLSIIKAIDQNPDLLSHQFFNYQTAIPGYGHCIHTYSLIQTCVPFTGEPYWVRFFDDIDEGAAFYWSILPDDKRVALYIKHVNITNGDIKDRILSIHK